MGEFGKNLIFHIEQNSSIKIKKVFDKKAEQTQYKVRMEKFYTVNSPSRLSELKDNDVIVIASCAYLDEIHQYIYQHTKDKKIEIISI